MRWFNNLSLSLKITLSFCCLLLIVLAFGSWTYLFSRNVHLSNQQVLEESAPFAELASEMQLNIVQVQQWLTDISATRGRDGLDDGFAEAEASYTAVIAGLDRFEEMYRRENDSAMLQQLQKIRADVAEYYEVGKQMAQLYIAEGPAGGNPFMARFDAAAAAMTASLEPFIAQQLNELHSELEKIQQQTDRLQTGVIYVCALAAVLMALIGWILKRSLANPLEKTVAMVKELENGHLQARLQMQRSDELGEMAATMDRFADSLQHEVIGTLEKIGQGDLTTHITPRDNDDRVRSALQRVQNELARLLEQIQSSGEQISAGSMQVADASQSLSQGATESASSIEQIGASVNEMASQTRLNAENAHQANQLAAQTSKIASSGNQRMNEMVAAMQEIDAAGQDIIKVIKVIDEIAFQTNLLALNAAVEAARAGQHGKGFAVVAEEVRNLAARSAKAARETAELIEGSVEKTVRGSEIATSTSQALSEIVGSIDQVTDLVAEINAASNEQAQGIDQINQALTQIDQVIQQNTASAEESAATSEELSGQANHLNQMLQRFRLTHSYR